MISRLLFLNSPVHRIVQAGISWPTKPRPCLCGSSSCQPPEPPSCSMKKCLNPDTTVRYSSKIRGWTATCTVSDPHKSIWANGRWLGEGCGRGLSKARDWRGLAGIGGWVDKVSKMKFQGTEASTMTSSYGHHMCFFLGLRYLASRLPLVILNYIA